MFRTSESKVVLLIFRSGRIVLTGGRDMSCLNEAWARMHPVLKKYVVREAKRPESAKRGGSVYAT